MIRVLFVDDDPLILAGLKRLMRRYAREMHAEFAADGIEALATLQQAPFDAIVSDMRMPGMDGAELLNRVRNEFPGVVRLILSGQSPHESMFRALGPAHQFLSKPCRVNKLRDFLIRALRVRDRLANPELRALVVQVEKLPSMPRAYAEVVEQLHSPRGSIERVGQIIAQDVAMTSKILQLVNSSFFGIREPIRSPSQAVCLLGIELVKALVLTVGVFAQFKQFRGDAINVEQLAQHSIGVGETARRIARQLGDSPDDADEALLAGMMHDIGKLVLAAERSQAYADVMHRAAHDGGLLWQIEEEVFGTSHAEVGAYLLSLWGFPNSIVEAVAFHHQPSQVGGAAPIALTAVHMANALAHDRTSRGDLTAETLLDLNYIASADMRVDWTSLVGAAAATIV